MLLRTFINDEHYMNIVNIVVGTLCQGYFTKILLKHLGHTECIEHVFMGMLVSNSLSVKITLANLKMHGGNNCSIYNIKSYGINGEMHVNK